MELLKESIGEESGRPVINFNSEQQCTSTDSPNEMGLGLGLALPLEQNAELHRSPAHNPTYEVTEERCERDLNSETALKDNSENSSHVAAELSIVPLIDVGVGLAPKSKKQFQGNISSLSVIANYGSSSETDSDDYSENNRYFKPNVAASTPSVISSNIPVDYRSIQNSSSDDSESNSESSDDESSSSSSTDGRATPTSRNSHVGAAKGVKKKRPIMMGDPLHKLPPIEDLQISVPEDSCVEIGFVSSIVEQQVIIQAKKGVPALDLGSVLFLERGKRTLGEIFDVFGQVTEPFYSVRFNSAQHVQEKGIEKGMTVYCAPQTEHTSLVFVQELMKLKGSDPSWEYTDDSPPHSMDYSDDEDEQRNNPPTKRNGDRGDHSDLDIEPTPRKRVNSFERRMNERNLRKSALPHDSTNMYGGLVRGSVRGRRHITGGRNIFVKSQFGFNHFPAGRGRAMTISFGGLPPNFGTAIGNQRMNHPINFGPIQPPNLTLPPPLNNYGPIQPPHSLTPQANSPSCPMIGLRPTGPLSDYRASQRHQSNMQHISQPPPTSRPANNPQQLSIHHVNTLSQPPSMQCPINKSQPVPIHLVNTHNPPPIQHPNTGNQPPSLPHPNSLGQRPPMQHPNNNSQTPLHNTNCLPPTSNQPPNTNGNHPHPPAQPIAFPPPCMPFSPFIPPANRPRMDNSDGQYPHFGVMSFMPPQTFQAGSQNNSFFSTPPPGFGAVPGFQNRIRPQAFQPIYGQMPPMFYQDFQPPQLPPGTLPNTMASMFSRPPPAPPNGGV